MKTSTNPNTPTQVRVSDHVRPISVMDLITRAGSLLDPEGLEGLASLTGELLTCGCKGMDRAAFQEAVDRIGSTLSVQVGRETMSLGGDALTRHLDTFEDLAARALNEPTFDAVEIDRMKRQFIAELAEVRDSDGALGQRAFAMGLFAGHPYGRFLKGRAPSIERITRDDIMGWYENNLRSGDALAGASGDIDAPRLQQLVDRTLGRLPDGAPALPPIPPPPVCKGTQVHLVDKPDRSQVQIAIGQPAIGAKHPDYLPFLVANAVFGGTFTSRLSQEIREKRGWSYGAYSMLAADRHLGTFTMRTYPAAEHAVETLKIIREMLTTYAEDGPTDEEIAFATRYLIQSHVFSLETADRRLQEQMADILHERGEGYAARYISELEALEPDTVRDVVRRLLTPKDQVISLVGTASELVPALKAWDGMDTLKITDYREL